MTALCADCPLRLHCDSLGIDPEHVSGLDLLRLRAMSPSEPCAAHSDKVEDDEPVVRVVVIFTHLDAKPVRLSRVPLAELLRVMGRGFGEYFPARMFDIHRAPTPVEPIDEIGDDVLVG